MNILVISAHPDDEVLGVGGTIARHASEGHEVYVAIVTEGASTQYREEPQKIEQKRIETQKVARILGIKEVIFGEFPDMQLDALPIIHINGFLEKTLKDVSPQLVYTHHMSDLNRDHRIVYESTLVAARPFACSSVKSVLSYHVHAVTDWGGAVSEFDPNIFVDISSTLECKLDAMQAYETEVRQPPHPRSLEVIKQVAYRNGSIVGLRAAEVFQLIREVR